MKDNLPACPIPQHQQYDMSRPPAGLFWLKSANPALMNSEEGKFNFHGGILKINLCLSSREALLLGSEVISDALFPLVISGIINCGL